MKDLVKSYVITFVFCFMLLIYEPIMMYSTNMNDFWFDFGIMIVPVLKIFFIILLLGCSCFTILYLINKKFSKKLIIYRSLLLIFAVVFLATYIQGNYLIGDLPILDGSDIDWNSFTTNNIITCVVWLVIVVGTIFSVVKLHLEKTVKYASYLSVVVFFMLMTSLLSVSFSKNAIEKQEKHFVISDNINTISKNKNLLIFMIDATDSKKFYDVWQNDDDFKDIFDDFTYYSDTMSAHPYTRESVPYVLTGDSFKNQAEFTEYSSNAYNNSKLFKNLTDRNYQINIYEDALVWNGKYNYDVKNIVSSNKAKIKLFSFFKQEMKYVLFKYAPYGLKKYSKIDGMNFDLCVEAKFKGKDQYVYDLIKNTKDLKKINDNYFQFIHVDGSHQPYTLNKQLQTIENGTYEDKIAACLTMIKAYINRLKDNGTYDNSIIIVMSDHGYFRGKFKDLNQPHLLRDEFNVLERMNPTFLVKGFNEHHDTIFSDAPVHYDDLQDMYVDLLDDKKSTDLFKDLEKDRKRTFLAYVYAKEDHMIEYETTGTARDIDKFKETGNVYDR